MKSQCHKGLLIPWLREALDKKLYDGLGWENKELGIFYIVWTHKSAEHWSIDVLKPFRAWAEFKGKLTNKNPKTLKATFRCALNSKKDELRELKRQRNRRFWQFIDPKIDQGKLANKKGPKPNNKRMTVEPNNRVNSAIFNSSADSSAEDFLKSSEEKTTKKRKRRTECKPVDDISPSTKIVTPSNAENHSTKCFSPDLRETQNQSRTDKLPSFQSIYNFQPLTPPYQDNEMFFSPTEYSIGMNSPDASRLTPPPEIPPKNYTVPSQSSPYYQQPSADVWQPNCWSITSTQQSFTTMNQFSIDWDELRETAVQRPRGDRVDFAERDQSVPVMNMDNQAIYHEEPSCSPSKPVPDTNQIVDQMRLEDLFTNNYETWEKIFQEFNIISTMPDSGGFNYNS